MKIQVADPEVLALRGERDRARDRMREAQGRCGCWGGVTCDVCAEASDVAIRLAYEYQAVYTAAVLAADSGLWWLSLATEWPFKGDAAQTEH